MPTAPLLIMDMALDTIEYAHAEATSDYSTADDLDGADWAMIGVGALATAGIGAAIYCAATAEPGEYQAPVTNDTGAGYQDSGSDGIGLGMSYGGDLGLEIAPGVVYTFDGELGLGFGF